MDVTRGVFWIHGWMRGLTVDNNHTSGVHGVAFVVLRRD
jgi:hypothetical protein